MSKIYFVGDTHIMSTSPSSRNETAEEYRQLQYDKLKQVYDMATDEDLVIFFSPYELSYYAKGFIEFPVRMTELNGILKEEYRAEK